MKWKISVGGFFILALLCFAYVQSYHLAGRFGMKAETELEIPAKDVSVSGSKKVSAGQAELSQYGAFYLTEENDRVIVYRSGSSDVYEYTNIKISNLPESIQEEISGGMYLENFSALYNFLENYST